MNNGTDKDSWGGKKLNAWSWLLSNYGVVITFAIGFIIIGSIYVSEAPLVGAIIAIGVIILGAIGFYAPKWYKKLVDGNYIKTFASSNFWEIFKNN